MLKHGETIKVVVVDDSPFMRKILSDILNSDSQLEVIGSARNGKEAIETIKTLKPDILTLDIEMPIMDGLEALKIIMENHPMPIVMLSARTYEGGKSTMTALELGAIDFIQKPSNIFSTKADALKNEIIDKIKGAYKAKIFDRRKKVAKTSVAIPSPRKSEIIRAVGRGKHPITQNIIAIGTSTGGPRALQNIIPLIPEHFPASVLIVQHMPEGFTKSLAERLDSISSIRVKEAEDSEEMRPGHAYIAPGNFHLEVKEGKLNKFTLHLSQKPAVSGHRPSADVMFKSLSNLKSPGINILGVIMTGMGSDGTKGLIELKNKTFAHIIAQDEESCVVYGMPKSAVSAGVVDEIVSLEKIISIIVNRVEVL